MSWEVEVKALPRLRDTSRPKLMSVDGKGYSGKVEEFSYLSLISDRNKSLATLLAERGYKRPHIVGRLAVLGPSIRLQVIEKERVRKKKSPVS